MRGGIRLSWGDLDLREVKSPEELPEEFNISAALLDRHLVQGRGAQTALLGPAGRFTYEQLYHFTNQVANAFRALGLDREQRVFLLLRDSPEFVASFLAAQRIGAIPVPVNTAAHPSDYEHYLRLTEPRLLVGDSEFLPALEGMLGASSLRCVLSVRGPGIRGAQSFEEIVSKQSEELGPAATHRDDSCHWWFTSGSTGESKAAVHLHRDMVFCLEPYLRYGLQMTPQDITFSVSRMTFSCGLVNSLYLPLWVGAAALLLPERPEPSQVLQAVDQYQPTLLFSVPTFYAKMLRDLGETFDRKKLKSLRLCISAGEALPSSHLSGVVAENGFAACRRRRQHRIRVLLYDPPARKGKAWGEWQDRPWIQGPPGGCGRQRCFGRRTRGAVAVQSQRRGILLGQPCRKNRSPIWCCGLEPQQGLSWSATCISSRGSASPGISAQGTFTSFPSCQKPLAVRFSVSSCG